ncbi:MAG TPA: helix-turn-helix transcriptional regulator [Solirubrobacterales bacterium]|nr:helix-turn-helix transcriptional regulator [Solirubrobacterales bacterium]
MGADLEVARRFGANLRRARRRADLSQEQLGSRASLHWTEIGLLERGARMPRIDTLVKLATALEIRPGELIEGIAWTPGTAEAGAFTIKARAELGRRGLPDEPGGG